MQSLAAVRLALGHSDAGEVHAVSDEVVSIAGVHVSVRWAGRGLPRDVRRVLDRDVGEPPLVITAERLTPESIHLVRERGFGYADLHGQARIVFPGSRLVIVREPPARSGTIGTTEGRDQALPGRPARGMRWSVGALLVAEWILVERQVGTIAQISHAVGLSHARVAQVLADLDEAGLTLREGGRGGPTVSRRADRQQLLDTWATAMSTRPRDQVNAHTTQRDPEVIAHQVRAGLDRLGTWAVSGWLAGTLLAPITSQTPSLQIYLADDAFRGLDTATLRRLGLTRVEEPGRVALWPAPTYALSLATRQGQHGVPVCHPVRVYADLMRLGGRGLEAADHLRKALL